MAVKPFSRQRGSDHFPELRNEHLASFNQCSYFIEVDAEIELADLLDAMTWGPQPKLQRGGLVTVMRNDNQFFATLICEASSAGYPTLRILTLVERGAPARAEPLRVGDDGVEMVLTTAGAAHVVTHAGEIAGISATAGDADAALAALVAANA